MKNKLDIREYLNQSVKDNIFPGCHAVVISQDKEDFYNIGYRCIYPNKELNQEDTIYDLASLTKVIVTTPLILKLIEMERLTLTTPVYQILPKFIHHNITVEHLLCHCSGLPADSKLPINSSKSNILQMIYHINLEYQTGTNIVYSDLGFILLGEIIETITQQNLNEISQEWLFKPMNMLNTSYLPKEKLRCAPTELSLDTNEMFQGKVHDRKARMMGGISGHAGLFSTVKDLSHYAHMLLNNGVYQNQVILKPESIALLYTTKVFNDEVSRGAGYITNTPVLFSPVLSNQVIMHTGFTGTSIMVDFSKQIAIIVLSNRVHPSRQNTNIIAWRNQFYNYVMK